MDDAYSEPVLYDLEYADHTEDIHYYVKMGTRAPGAVLELACGNGRITLPLARAGVKVTGIDISRPMLDDLADKLEDEHPAVQKRVQIAQGDFCSLQADGDDGLGTFPLVMLPFNAIHHCMTPEAVLELLQGVRRCMAPGALFAMDCFLPDPDLYDRDPDERHEPRSFHDPRTGDVLTSWERSWYEREGSIHNVVYSYLHRDGRQEDVHLRLRMFHRQELRALFDQAGFKILNQSGGFDGRKVASDALKWVLLLTTKEA